MCSPVINAEGELRGNRLTQVHLEKWPCVCVCPREWVCGEAKIFGSALLQPARSVCVSLSVFHFVLVVGVILILTYD